jgi:hypothetical protein
MTDIDGLIRDAEKKMTTTHELIVCLTQLAAGEIASLRYKNGLCDIGKDALVVLREQEAEIARLKDSLRQANFVRDVFASSVVKMAVDKAPDLQGSAVDKTENLQGHAREAESVIDMYAARSATAEANCAALKDELRRTCEHLGLDVILDRAEKAEAELARLRERVAALEADVERERIRLAACGVAALGYHKDGDSIHPDYESASLSDVHQLTAKLKRAEASEADARTKIAAQLIEIGRLQEKIKEEQRGWALQFTARQRAEAECAALIHDNAQYAQRNTERLAEVEGMRKDADRLNTLTSFGDRDVMICAPGQHGGNAKNWLLSVEHPGEQDAQEWEGSTLRAAIDAATQEQK